MKFSVFFGTKIYSKGHEYAPWQYERMPHKQSMVNRLIRTKLSAEAKWWIVGIDRKQINVLCSIPIFVGFCTCAKPVYMYYPESVVAMGLKHC